jgi:hypothetical protein
MPIINCYIDDDTLQLLREASDAMGRKVEELAEAAIANAAIDYKNSRPKKRDRINDPYVLPASASHGPR